MSRVESEPGETAYKNLIPLEGQPGRYTFREIKILSKEEIIKMQARATMKSFEEKRQGVFEKSSEE